MQLSVTAVLGASACALALLACTCKDDVWLKRAVLVAMILWAPYYWLLGAPSGFVFSVLIVIRQFLSLNLARISPPVATAAMVALLLAITTCLVMTWEGPRSLLPWFAAVNSTYAYMRLQGARLRAQVIFGEGGWAIYALVVGAWAHLAFIFIALALSLWTIHRLKRAATPSLATESAMPTIA